MRSVHALIKKNPLFYSFFFPALVDGTVTLLGQSQEYWNNQRVVDEASPAFYFLLASPWAFILGSIVWFTFWYWLFKKLKEPVNLFLMFLFISGHSWGSTSWIWNLMKKNSFYSLTNQISIIFAWSLAVLYFIMIALFAAYCLGVHLERKRKG